MSEPMNFDNWKYRIAEIKQLWECEWSTVGMSTHVRHDDVGWLLEFIETQRKLIESYGRVTKGMTEYLQSLEKINKELREFKRDAEKLFQRQKLGFAKSTEKVELYENALKQIYDTASKESIDEFMAYGYIAKKALEE